MGLIALALAGETRSGRIIRCLAQLRTSLARNPNVREFSEFENAFDEIIHWPIRAMAARPGEVPPLMEQFSQ